MVHYSNSILSCHIKKFGLFGISRKACNTAYNIRDFEGIASKVTCVSEILNLTNYTATLLEITEVSLKVKSSNVVLLGCSAKLFSPDVTSPPLNSYLIFNNKMLQNLEGVGLLY